MPLCLRIGLAIVVLLSPSCCQEASIVYGDVLRGDAGVAKSKKENLQEQKATTAISDFPYSEMGLTLAGFGLVATGLVTLPFYLGRNQEDFVWGKEDAKQQGLGLTSQEWDSFFDEQQRPASPRASGAWDGCWQMAICDSHARYDDYGIMALPLVLFYPGTRTAEGEPASIWQAAAMKGKAREDCESSYRCLINPMLIAKFFMTLLVE